MISPPSGSMLPVLAEEFTWSHICPSVHETVWIHCIVCVCLCVYDHQSVCVLLCVSLLPCSLFILNYLEQTNKKSWILIPTITSCFHYYINLLSIIRRGIIRGVYVCVLTFFLKANIWAVKAFAVDILNITQHRSNYWQLAEKLDLNLSMMLMSQQEDINNSWFRRESIILQPLMIWDVVTDLQLCFWQT